MNATSIVQTYRFRAECSQDIAALLKVLGLTHKSITVNRMEHGLPDVEATIQVKMDIESLRNKMRQVPDGHVMVQTVAPVGKYDGTRNYAL